VRTFARHQRDSLTDFEVETLPGVRLGQRNIPVAAAGAYVPGGRYPLTASAHMTIVTAKVPGCPVAACTPPIHGEIPAATVARHAAGRGRRDLPARRRTGHRGAGPRHPVDRRGQPAGRSGQRVRRRGQAAAVRRGRHRPVRGPTEILVIADDTADPVTVAVDLLSQAEHGPDSPAILVTTPRKLGRIVLAHIEKILPGMPTKDFAEPAWRDHGQIIVTGGLDEAFAVADSFAAEHVEVLTASPGRPWTRCATTAHCSSAPAPASRTATR